MVRFIIICLAVSVSYGCNGNAATQRPSIVQIGQAGNVQPFSFVVFNGTQLPIFVWPTVNLNGQVAAAYAPYGGAISIPQGSYVTGNVGFLPSSVSVQAVANTVPPYFFIMQTKRLYIDYSYTDTRIVFTFQ